MKATIRLAALVVMASLAAAGCSSREENQTPTERSTMLKARA